MLNKYFRSDILFTGYYGELNTGDDAFVEVASWGAVEYWNKESVIFLGKDRFLPDVTYPTKGFPLNIPKTYSLQTKFLVSNTNYFISAGGSTIHSKMAINNPKIIALNRKKIYPKLKIGAIGVSIGPFNTSADEKHTIEYLKSIDFLAVRDKSSFDFVNSLELPYEPINSFDLAALLPDIYGIQKPTREINKKIIGISVCPVESINNHLNIQNELIRNQQIINLIKFLDANENIHFKFLIINGNSRIGDEKLTREIIKNSAPKSAEIISYQKHTHTMWKEIISCDFIVATRLHAAVFACFSGTPFMLHEYHKKCSDFLDNIDYEYAYRLFNNEYDIQEKAYQILSIINDSSEYILPNKVENMKERAKLNFTGVTI